MEPDPDSDPQHWFFLTIKPKSFNYGTYVLGNREDNCNNCYSIKKIDSSTMKQLLFFRTVEGGRRRGDCIDRVATGYSAPMFTNPAIGLVVTTQDLLNTVHGSSTQ